MGGTFTHLWIAWEHGLFWDYDGSPLISCIFWTSLTFLDPAAAALLFARPAAGLMLTAVIIVLDVSHNAWSLLREGAALVDNVTFMLQVAFLAFLSLTFASAWRGLPAGLAKATTGP